MHAYSIYMYSSLTSGHVYYLFFTDHFHICIFAIYLRFSPKQPLSKATDTLLTIEEPGGENAFDASSFALLKPRWLFSSSGNARNS